MSLITELQLTFLGVAAGVTSHGLSCGVCKYKAHKACVGNVLAGCKWSTRETVEQRFISLENVSSLKYSLTATFACVSHIGTLLYCFLVSSALWQRRKACHLSLNLGVTLTAWS